MALISVEKREKSTAEIIFSIDEKSFADAQTKAYQTRVKKMNIQGFRPGKAPRNIVEKMYGKGVFYNDALDATLPSAYESAVEEAKLKTVGSPDFDIDKIEEGQGVVVKAIVSLYPVVTVADYKGIPADRHEVEATAEDVDHDLYHIRERNSRTVEITDRAAETGDTANIDFEGFLDGVPFEGGKGEKFDLKLGSGQFIPGFEEQIAGHKIGESFDVNVSFPEEYGAAELAGKAAVFAVTVNSLKVEQMPDADDEFAKDVSDFDTLAEYRADLAAKIVERKAKAQDKAVENAVSEALIAKVEGDIPEVMYEREAENFVRDFDMHLRQQGMNLDTYLKYTNGTIDSLRAQYIPQATSQVKLRLALEKIVELEGIKVTPEDVEKEIDDIAATYNMERDEVTKHVTVEHVGEDLKVKRAFDFVKAAAVITTLPPVKEDHTGHKH